MEAERSRLKVFAFDEGGGWLGDPIGRLLLASLQANWGGVARRADHLTQLIADALLDGASPSQTCSVDVRLRAALGARGGASARAARHRPRRPRLRDALP